MKILSLVALFSVIIGFSTHSMEAKVLTFQPSKETINWVTFQSSDDAIAISKRLHEGAQCPDGGAAIVVEVTEVRGGKFAGIDFPAFQVGNVKPGQEYVVEIWLAASDEVSFWLIAVEVGPWRQLANQAVTLTNQWKKYTLTTKVDKDMALIQPFRMVGLNRLPVGTQLYIGQAKLISPGVSQ